ncbi:lysine N(6)-hydroxylase/L-ornithine N(5)-oxygenase family protein [Azospirillum palustre]
MTQFSLSEKPLDLAGIGFGPSNIGLAIALEEQAERSGRALDTAYFDRQDSYSWHGGTLVQQSDLQISFLKDLVTLRNPQSPYSFVNYLHRKERLIDFINIGTFYPCRMEFNDYLCWVASHFSDACRYGTEVVRVEPVVDRSGVISMLDVVTRGPDGIERVRRTRSLVVGTGGTPRIPALFAGLKDDPRVFHHADYVQRIATQPCVAGTPMRIALVGGGQSAAEAFIDLNDSFPSVRADMILRSAVLRPADDTPFVNEIFAPAYTDVMFNLPEDERAQLIRDYHNTNYSVVDAELIDRIYGILYRQKVSGVQRHGFLCRRQIEAVASDGAGIALTLRDLSNGVLEEIRYDAVVLATGYERNSHRRLLEPLGDLTGDLRVDRDYRVSTDPKLTAPVFIQGFCEETHGLSDTLLSVLPVRAAEIAAALYRDLAPADGRSRRQSGPTGLVAGALNR